MWISLVLAVSLAQPPTQAIPLDETTKAKLKEIAFDAARQGDTVTLREYFKAGMPAEIISPRGDTLLILAAYHGHAEAVELIAGQPGTPIDYRNKMGFTALTAAAFKGSAEVTKILLKHKATVNTANESGQTPLMFAATFGRLEVARLLIAAGADISAKDKEGNTALLLAKKQNRESVVELLEKSTKK